MIEIDEKPTQHFEINTEGTDYFVGDLHGMYFAFKEKLTERNFNPNKDRVFSVGDLIDRGPKSYECLNLLNEPWFHCVLGNHEDFLLGSHDSHVWFNNGGDWVREYWDSLPEFKELVNNNCYQFITVDTKYGKFGVVHAESESDWNKNGYWSRDKNLWARSKIKREDDTPIENIDLVVCGHTPLKRVVTLGNVVYIDTGAVYGEELQLLTAEELHVKL